MNDDINLTDLPMPPSANKRLTPIKGRLFKSQIVREFDHKVQVWILKKGYKIHVAREKAKGWIEKGYLLKIELVFFWPKENLISKDGTPKRIDSSNRLKEAEDAVSEILEVDDKYFINHIIYKVPYESPEPTFSVIVSPTKWV
ncbi:MAG: RusA family crossover junction endodeoxyribonuclease [Bdellovibrionales bacterium]|nr:RusA family crossover junction endodeoxyribonuclease [Bdellovibrionales bacterium]